MDEASDRFAAREWKDRAHDMERERDEAYAVLREVDELPLDADITDAHNITARLRDRFAPGWKQQVEDALEALDE